MIPGPTPSRALVRAYVAAALDRTTTDDRLTRAARLYLMGPERSEGSLVSTLDTDPAPCTLDTNPANRGIRSKKVGPVPGAEPLPRRAQRQSSGPPPPYEGGRTA